MQTTLIFRRLWLPLLVGFVVASADAQLIRPAAGAITGLLQEDTEVQTSGPVHEGFASPVVFEEEAEPFYTDVDPPHLIEETPPLERPEGYSEWVPGYWVYDDDRRHYCWVSGTWRVPPPSHVWVSGYWVKTWKGWRYVAGFWAPASYASGDVEYLPAPPASLENGAPPYAPFPNAIWIPGNWIWYSGGYMGWVWRPGYWVVANLDWIWVPAHYQWTPYGYVYIEGHYDHPVDQCGLLFAPVYFPSSVYLTSGYTYTPGFVINITLFGGGLFARPSYGHYYFGDFYGETSWKLGIYPAFSFHYSKYGYDPIFAHAHWKHAKSNPNWVDQQRTHYLYLREHKEARPPKTLAQQLGRPKGAVKFAPGVDASEGGEVAVSLKNAGKQATGLKLGRVPESDRAKLVAQAHDMKKARQARAKAEAPGQGTSGERNLPTAPVKVKTAGFVPGSVVAASGNAKVESPKAPELPKVDHNAKAEPDRVDPRGGFRGGRPSRSKLKEPSLDEPAAKDKAVPKTDPNAKTDPKPDPRGRDPRVDPKTDPNTKTDPKKDPTPKTDPKTDPKPDPRGRDPRVDPKTDPNTKTDPKTDPKPDPRGRDPRVDPKTDPNTKTDPKTDPKPDPRGRDPRVDPKTDPNTKTDPKKDPTPKTDPKTDPKPDPRGRDPRLDPKTDPNTKTDPKKDPTPKTDPKTDPKPDPRGRDPRVDPKTDPNAKPDPKKDPNAKPEPNPRGRDPKADPKKAPKPGEQPESQPVKKPSDKKPPEKKPG